MPSTLFQPDLLFWKGQFREGLGLEVSAEGSIVGALPLSKTAGVVRLPGRALLPGLVNAHSHAFQRLIRGRTEFVAAGRAADDFWSWRELMYRAASTLDPEQVYAASRQAFLEMALAGITAVGEFHYLHHAPDGRPYAQRHQLAHQVIRAARDVGLRIVLLRVGYARSGFQVPPNPRQARFLDPDVGTFLSAVDSLRAESSHDPLVTVGLAPHSVRAVPREWLTELGKTPGVMHMHVAEQPAEISACLAEHGRRPVELLSEAGLLRKGFTAVHAIHLEPSEIAALGTSGAAVCACPSTEANLGDGVIPADALVRAAVPLCLGSDSQATIDLLEEGRQLESHLRLVRRRRAVLDLGTGEPDAVASHLLRAATVEGARALGLPTGALVAGAPADFFTVDLHHPTLAGANRTDLLPTLFFGGRAAVREVAVQGKWIVQDGLHPLAEPSRRDFTALVQKVFG